ncbi:MAG: immunity 49 family protein [Flavobacteriaceae bacterium]|nr:immunity 49 family protein [Flavobacteriaceae bacterium]
MEELAQKSLKREQEIPQQIIKYQSTVSYDSVASALCSDNEIIGIFEVSQNNFIKAKQRFFNCGWLDCYSIEKYNDRFLDYNFIRPLIALLSDNEELIQRYAQLRYRSFYRKDGEEEFTPLTMEEMVEDGEGAVWANTIQYVMANDMQGVQRNLNIIKTKRLKNVPTTDSFYYDYGFFKALYENDKTKIEEILEKFLSPKIHKERNDSPFSKYISMPALGYAKLAWRRGLEVEIKSKLIPKELLPIQPLEKYEIPYDFLR